jgi:hypothetical protein
MSIVRGQSGPTRITIELDEAHCSTVWLQWTVSPYVGQKNRLKIEDKSKVEIGNLNQVRAKPSDRLSQF